jgi:hypothetical protein
MGNHRRIAKLEKVIGSERKMTWKQFIESDAWPDFPRGLETLSQALTEITGKEITPAETEKQLGKLFHDNPS